MRPLERVAFAHAIERRPLSIAENDAVIAQCRHLIAALPRGGRHQRASELRLSPLQISSKAWVLLAEPDREPPSVVKVNLDRDAFAMEHFALELLAESQAVPRLIAVDEERQALIMEFVPHEVLAQDVHDLERVAGALGDIHRLLESARELLREVYLRPTLDDFTAEVTSIGAFRDAGAAIRATECVAEAHGPGHIAVSVGDIKRGHVRARNDGSIAFVDLETMSATFPEIYDVLTLLNLAADDYTPSLADWQTIVTAYWRARAPELVHHPQIEPYLRALDFAHRSAGLTMDAGDRHTRSR